jgi:hypothetical protein
LLFIKVGSKYLRWKLKSFSEIDSNCKNDFEDNNQGEIEQLDTDNGSTMYKDSIIKTWEISF